MVKFYLIEIIKTVGSQRVRHDWSDLPPRLVLVTVGENVPASEEDAGNVGSISSQEDPLEEEMATHSSILVWKIPWPRSLAGCSPWGRRVGHDWACPHAQLLHNKNDCLWLGQSVSCLPPNRALVFLSSFELVLDVQEATGISIIN